MILRFLIRENQIREKSGNLIVKMCGHPDLFHELKPFIRTHKLED